MKIIYRHHKNCGAVKELRSSKEIFSFREEQKVASKKIKSATTAVKANSHTLFYAILDEGSNVDTKNYIG